MLDSFSRMKNTVIISLFVIAVLGCQSAPPKQVSNDGIHEKIDAPPTLQFRGETYEAKYSALGGKLAIVEYYRPGEGPKSWKSMLGLRLDENSPDSLELVTNMRRMIEAQGNHAVRTYQSTNGHGVEFILATPGRHELNVFRYLNRTNGTVSLQYAEIIPTKKIGSLDPIKGRLHCNSPVECGLGLGGHEYSAH
jgi:hypothetical protein